MPDKVHEYLVAHAVRETAVQRALRAATRGIPGAGMQIAPEQGALMQVLVRLIGAKRYLEIGTFTGYSALCVALAMPASGRLVCCDLSDEWTSIARKFWRKARVASKIRLRLAPALETLDALLREGEAGRYDLAFIDADKGNYLGYFERCMRLVRRGGVIAIDNTLWGGRVVDPSRQDGDTRAIRAFNRRLHRDRRIEVALVPIGDGLTLAYKR
ncbi:MAG TPA: class I SAM-dependent methyltransferase [Burkholderiales bacterium]|jgi:predicted O-methyltransferase YrrM|nr:class I SAM-dependent methyltransferase [Burkholderiales bacterium]